MKNIYLIGMPGCGKTTIGRATGKKIEKNFSDIDSNIEKSQNMKIKHIFKRFGENHFRKLESMELKKASLCSDTIVSCGGGIVLDTENIKVMKETGTIVFINVELEYLEKRAIKSTRPLLKDGADALKRLYDVRIGIYNDVCDVVLQNDTGRKTAVNRLVDIINKI